MNTGVLNISDSNKIVAASQSLVVFSRDTSIASGTSNVTGAGFKPRSVIFHASDNSGAVGKFCVITKGRPSPALKTELTPEIAVTAIIPSLGLCYCELPCR